MFSKLIDIIMLHIELLEKIKQNKKSMYCSKEKYTQICIGDVTCNAEAYLWD